MTYITIEIRITEGQNRVAEGQSQELGKAYLVSASARMRNDEPRYAQAAFTISPDIETRLDTILRVNKVRDTGSLEGQVSKVRQFGMELFSYLFTSGVKDLYEEIKRQAAQSQATIRLRLRIIPPELSTLPWEMLHDSERYLCLRGYPKILFARVPDISARRRTLIYTPPLRILGIMATPKNEEELDIDEEQRHINSALSELMQKQYVMLSWKKAEAEMLTDLRRGDPWHILHFIGHGRFDDNSKEGKLVFEDIDGEAHYYDANQLSLALHKDIQLVFLNACDTARGDPLNYLSNFAYNLATSGVPAIVAMQFKITDNAAIRFSKVFYERVAAGDAVDEAVAEARHSVYIGTNRNRLDWAAPVLYISTVNNALFRRAVGSDVPALAKIKKSGSVPVGTGTISGSQEETSSASQRQTRQQPTGTPKIKRRRPIDIREISRRLPRPPLWVYLASIMLVGVLIAGAIFGPNILNTFNHKVAKNTTRCNINTAIAPAAAPLVPFTTQVLGMKPSKGVNGDNIGLSAGSLIFDTVTSSYCDLLQAAQYRETNDLENFTSKLNTVTTTTDRLDAEAKIYEEDDSVFNSGSVYIELVIGGSFAQSNIGSTIAMLQGAYIAQKEYNDDARGKNEPLLTLVIANAGDDAKNTQIIANDIVALSQNNPNFIGTIGWPFSSYALNLNSALSHENIPLVSSAASSNLLTNRQWFARIVPPDAEQAHIAAEYVKTLIKPTDPIAIVIANNDNNYSSSIAGSFYSEFSTPPLLEKYDPNASDPFTSVISDLMNKQIALIYFTGYAGDMGKMLDTLERSGNLDRFKLMGGDSLSVVSDYKKGQKDLDHLTFTAFANGNEWTDSQKAQAPIINRFLNEYTSQFGENPALLNGFSNLDTNTILAYDNTMVMLRAYQIAIQNKGTNDIRNALLNALGSMHGSQAFQGVSGQISFESGSGDPIKKQIIIASIENGIVKTKLRYNCFLVGDLLLNKC